MKRITFDLRDSGEYVEVDVPGGAAEMLGIFSPFDRRIWLRNSVPMVTGQGVADLVAITPKRGIRNLGFSAFVRLGDASVKERGDQRLDNVWQASAR